MADTELNLYDMAKQMAANEVPMSPDELNDKVAKICENIKNNNKYSMLLCRERNDFTIFKTTTADIHFAENEIKETLSNRGYILTIDPQEENNSWEIWVRDFDTKENFAYYLFDYTNGIVEV